MAPLLGLGLQLLPQIPKLWGAVAGMFGKDTPQSVTEAGDLAGEVLGMIGKGQVSPEVQVQLEARMLEHKETILKLQNERDQMYLKDEQHKRDTQVALWANDQKSADLEVQRTRPRILKEMWRTCQIFIFGTLLIFGAAMFMPLEIPTTEVVDGVEKVTIVKQARDMGEFMAIVKYLGAFLFSTFTAGFLGYTTARTIDKRNPNAKNGQGIGSQLLNTVLTMGAK